MKTLDTHEPGPGWRDDLALLTRMAAMLFDYWTSGARLRREYRRCEAAGQTYWVDRAGPTHHRESSVR